MSWRNVCTFMKRELSRLISTQNRKEQSRRSVYWEVKIEITKHSSVLDLAHHFHSQYAKKRGLENPRRHITDICKVSVVHPTVNEFCYHGQ